MLFRDKLFCFLSKRFTPPKDGHMKVTMKRYAPVFALTLICSVGSTSSLATESPENIAGVWSCTGVDEHAGKFTEQVVIKLDPSYRDAHSSGFDIEATLEGNATYHGIGIVSDGKIVSDFVSMSDQTDHGVLIGKIRTGIPVRMHARYFEMQSTTPSQGTETCTRTGD
jgi:hypothetical protein